MQSWLAPDELGKRGRYSLQVFLLSVTVGPKGLRFLFDLAPFSVRFFFLFLSDVSTLPLVLWLRRSKFSVTELLAVAGSLDFWSAHFIIYCWSICDAVP